MSNLHVSCEFPHEDKNKCLVIYVFFDVPSLLHGLPSKGYFSHILKRQLNAMGNKESPKLWGFSPLAICWWPHNSWINPSNNSYNNVTPLTCVNASTNLNNLVILGKYTKKLRRVLPFPSVQSSNITMYPITSHDFLNSSNLVI